MHPRRSWMVLCVLAAFAANAAVVYKWVDADGVIHYSDQPGPGAEKIYTAGPSTVAAGAPAPAAAPQKKPPGPLNFIKLAISSPIPDQSFFGGDVVGVHLAVDPALTPDQTVTWNMNGKDLTDQSPDTTEFGLQGLDRGTYTITATITDQKTGDTQSTPPVTFYVKLPTLLSPQHKNP